MDDPEEKADQEVRGSMDLDDSFLDLEKEEPEEMTTLFAVRTTINQESNVLRQIFYRFRILDVIPDIRAILISPMLPGYVFFEAPQKHEVQIAVQGIPHIKGRIVQNITLEELKHVLLPRSVTEFISVGDTVEIVSGVFEGARAVVIRMPHDTSSSEEVVVRLLQEETPITIKIHGDYLKLVEKKREEKKVTAAPTLAEKPTVQATITDLEKAISFDDDFESEYTEEYGEELEEVEEEELEYEEEEEEEDEWSKFDGF
ncbi:MAG: transcription elongation factor Spt5 [Promethearchaeota archaeon]